MNRAAILATVGGAATVHLVTEHMKRRRIQQEIDDEHQKRQELQERLYQEQIDKEYERRYR